MQGKTFVNVMKFPVPKTDESGYKSAFDQGEILARIPGPAGMIQPYYHRYFPTATQDSGINNLNFVAQFWDE